MSQNANAALPVLPAVEQALRPFIKTPAEIAVTRRHISSTLDTLIAAAASPTPSLTNQRAARCLTGTRKAYYSAAVENLRLRRQWAELVSDITLPVPPDAQVPTVSSPTTSGHTHSRAGSAATSHSRAGSINRLSFVAPAEKDPSEWTAVYDQVLELRRVFSQLTVLSKYQQRITALAQSRERPLTAVFADYAQQMPPVPPGGPLAGKEQGSTPGGGSGGWDEEVLLPLEKAVVDAQKRLQAEKEMLVEAKVMVSREGVELETLPDAVRTTGMVAAKEELEVWLDEQLRLAGEGSGTPRKEKRRPSMSVPEGAGENFDLDEQLAEIKRVYESYVASREKLLHAFLLAIQPVKKEVIPPKTAKDRGGGGAAGAGTTGKNEIPALLGVMDELGHWKARMDELTELMKAMKEGSVNAARDLDITMGKLHSESQLLENYGRGGVSISRKGSVSGDASPFQASIELAKAWEQAAEEAERSVREEVDRDTVHAMEKLAGVDELIEQVKALLPEEDSGRRERKDVTWRGLRGNVGFDDDV
ncbi:hypothetical protein Dda_5245 [Drechslerella dactyloides]|uniref:Uncharacterized protein n=1 Tax=Drechslerella dactyloides TaxID=74499 RepID=A0AAD6IWF0_DREDA|nr:hypothetical protein Dda_5245 [Drechslerella dactyloides]